MGTVKCLSLCPHFRSGISHATSTVAQKSAGHAGHRADRVAVIFIVSGCGKYKVPERSHGHGGKLQWSIQSGHFGRRATDDVYV